MLPKRWRGGPDKQVWRYGRAVKYGLLFLVLAAVGLRSLSAKHLWIVLALVVGLSVWSRAGFADAAHWKSDWRAAIEQIRERIAPGEKVYVEDHWGNEPARYYGRDLKVVLVKDKFIEGFAESVRTPLWVAGRANERRPERIRLATAVDRRCEVGWNFNEDGVRVVYFTKRVDASP